ncbi:hypothetical protein IEQ34_010409 [Dendrobium chrysotoxum]|uniref:Uncharacterized protein n=1 Tax=Dendrobium chrysotoxum TaxID=161865 RepID=A0AAV7H453_DENCH|nr:hypothetical protein IEQ34_010409 [Dendrobium chrysotoxum]
MVANFEGEANGALIASPQYSPRRRWQLQRIGMQQQRRVRNGLEIVLEEDPNLNSEVEDECFVPTSRICSYLSFMGQLKSAFIPSGNDQSKQWRRLANASSTITIAKLIPGHFLLPDPKGKYSKSCPLEIHFAIFKPFRPKLEWLLPYIWINGNSHDIEDNTCFSWDIISLDLT